MNEFDDDFTSKEKLKVKIVVIEDLVEEIETFIKRYEQGINKYLEEPSNYDNRDLVKLYKEAKKELDRLYEQLPIEKARLAYYKYCLNHFENINLEDAEKLNHFIELEKAKRERNNRFIANDEIVNLLEKREKIRKKLIKKKKRVESIKPHLIWVLISAVITSGIFYYLSIIVILGAIAGAMVGFCITLMSWELSSCMDRLADTIQNLEDELKYLNGKLKEIRKIEQTKNLEKTKTNDTDVSLKDEIKTVSQVIEEITDINQLKELRDKINREIESQQQEQTKTEDVQKRKIKNLPKVDK